MKTTTILAAALFLSTASFAQQANASARQTTKASVSGTKPTNATATSNSSASLSAKTTLSEDSRAKAAQVTHATEDHAETAKPELKEEGSEVIVTARQTANDTKSATTSDGSSASISAIASGNKTNQDASLYTDAGMSGEGIISHIEKHGGEVKQVVKQAATTTVKRTSAIAGSVKPKPAAVKIDSQIRTVTGIHIR